MKESGQLLSRYFNLSAESWVVQTRPEKGSSCSSQGASIALSGIYGCQRIDIYMMTVDILQDSNCAVKQLLAEHIFTDGQPEEMRYVVPIFETRVRQVFSAVTGAVRDTSWLQLLIRSLVYQRWISCFS
jgi:hypothetical protein